MPYIQASAGDFEVTIYTDGYPASATVSHRGGQYSGGTTLNLSAHELADLVYACRKAAFHVSQAERAAGKEQQIPEL